MEEDSKIIRIKKAEPEEFHSAEIEMKTLLQQLEEKLQNSMEHFRIDQKLERDVIRKEIQEIVESFEKRIRDRFHEMNLNPATPQAGFRVTGSMKKIGDIMRRIINVPDFELIHRSENVDEFGLDPSFEKQLLPFFQFFHDQYWRVETHGINHIPNSERALIVSNHSGTIPWDGAMIKVAVRLSHPVRREVRFLVEDFVYHFPFLGMTIARFGGVRACQENAERLLNQNQLVAVFPEGVKGIGKHYRNRYQLQRFGRGGLVRLALKTQSPIIPTAVIGAEEIYPLIARLKFFARPLGVPYIPITPFFPLLGPVGFFPLPSKWSITFGEPIDLQRRGYGPEAADDLLLVSRLNEEIRCTIQEMIKDKLSKRLSIWFG